MIADIKDSTHLIWTDALFAEQLAKNASNKFDKGSYVRWSIISAWTTFELACANAIGISEIKNLKQDINSALENQGFPLIDWGIGRWQKIITLKAKRIDAVHSFSERIEFPNWELAQDFISTIREAIKEIYITCEKEPPNWIDESYLFATEHSDSLATMSANLSSININAENDPEAIRITYIVNKKEFEHSIMPMVSGDYLSDGHLNDVKFEDLNKLKEDIFKERFENST